MPAGRYSAVSVGNAFVCALRVDVTIACWGFNRQGQLDAPAGEYLAVSAGGGHACALRAGASTAGGAVRGRIEVPPWRFTAVDTGGGQSCGLRVDGLIRCWGYRYGYHYVERAEAPPGLFVGVSAGGVTACGLRGNGTLSCAYDRYGPKYGERWAGPYRDISVRQDHVCAARVGGAAECWGGHNKHGETNAPDSAFGGRRRLAPLLWSARRRVDRLLGRRAVLLAAPGEPTVTYSCASGRTLSAAPCSKFLAKRPKVTTPATGIATHRCPTGHRDQPDYTLTPTHIVDNTTRSFSSGLFFEAFVMLIILTSGSNRRLCKKR